MPHRQRSEVSELMFPHRNLSKYSNFCFQLDAKLAVAWRVKFTLWQSKKRVKHSTTFSMAATIRNDVASSLPTLLGNSLVQARLTYCLGSTSFTVLLLTSPLPLPSCVSVSIEYEWSCNLVVLYNTTAHRCSSAYKVNTLISTSYLADAAQSIQRHFHSRLARYICKIVDSVALLLQCNSRYKKIIILFRFVILNVCINFRSNEFKRY